MNIATLVSKIINFNEIVKKSGFLRDITEFQQSIPNNSGNLVFLKDITQQIITHLEKIDEASLEDDLHIILAKKATPFTDTDHLGYFLELNEDSEINTTNFFNTLKSHLTNLRNQVHSNVTEIDRTLTYLQPYYNYENGDGSLDELSTFSIKFSNDSFFRSFKSLSGSLSKWEKVFSMYQLLVKSSAPEEVKLLSFQDGSLDIVTNIDINVAIDLTEIFKYAFMAFSGYLSYKTAFKPISDKFFNNEKLESLQKETEKEILDNILLTVQSKLLEQHEEKIKKDERISTESVPKKIDYISKVITEHVINGNDVKLLIDSSDNEEVTELKEDLSKETINVKRSIKKLGSSEIKLLCETYNLKSEEDLEG